MSIQYDSLLTKVTSNSVARNEIWSRMWLFKKNNDKKIELHNRKYKDKHLTAHLFQQKTKTLFSPQGHSCWAAAPLGAIQRDFCFAARRTNKAGLLSAVTATLSSSAFWSRPLPPSVRQVKPLIWIDSVIEKFSHSRVEIKVKVGDKQTVARVHAEHSGPRR